MAFIMQQEGSLVLYSNGSIVDRTKCPKHTLVVSRKCTCLLIVRIVHADLELASTLFKLVVKKWKPPDR